MKSLPILLSLMLLFFGITASAIDGSTCERKANQMQGLEREKFLKSCLAQMSAPAHVKEVARMHKYSSCEQNAKNKHLTAGKKTGYVDDCVNRNQAAAAKKEVASKTQEQSTAQAPAAVKAQPPKQAAAKPSATNKKHKKRKKNKSAA